MDSARHGQQRHEAPRQLSNARTVSHETGKNFRLPVVCPGDQWAECRVQAIALGVPIVCTTTSCSRGPCFMVCAKGGKRSTRLGQLERAVMDALWDMSASSPSSTFTRTTSRAHSPTMPTRLCSPCSTADRRSRRKNPDGGGKAPPRPGHVSPCRADARGAQSISDRSAALVYFAETVPPEQAKVLREVLHRLEQPRFEGIIVVTRRGAP